MTEFENTQDTDQEAEAFAFATELPDEIYTQKFTSRKKTIETVREDLEDILIDSLMDILRNADKMDIKLKAVQEGISLLGLKQAVEKKVQKDGRPEDDEDKKEDKQKTFSDSDIQSALIKSLGGLGSVTEGAVNDIKTVQGGHGA